MKNWTLKLGVMKENIKNAKIASFLQERFRRYSTAF